MDGGEPIKSSRTEGDGGFGDVSRGIWGKADGRFEGLFTSLYTYTNYIYTLRTSNRGLAVFIRGKGAEPLFKWSTREALREH
jgi:hypothetical protein